MNDEWVLKICSAGAYQVGKTSLIRRYSENKFEANYLPTIGVDITTKRIVINGQKIKLILMDTAGQEQFGNLRKSYFEGAAACIVVYDITRADSFEAINRWINDFRSVVRNEEIPIVVIGNKIDLENLRIVTTKEGKNYAKLHGFPFYECSAKLGGSIIPKIYEEIVQDYFKVQNSL